MLDGLQLIFKHPLRRQILDKLYLEPNVTPFMVVAQSQTSTIAAWSVGKTGLNKYGLSLESEMKLEVQEIYGKRTIWKNRFLYLYFRIIVIYAWIAVFTLKGSQTTVNQVE